MKKKIHTKKMVFTITLLAQSDATVQDVRGYLYDLEWAGGCRSPDDPMFSSVSIVSIKKITAGERR